MGRLFTFFLFLALAFAGTIALASPPAVSIDLPANATTVAVGDYVTFAGSATPAPGRTITEYTWTSSKDGVLSQQATFGLSTLSTGLHTITLIVQDDAGFTGNTAIQLTVRNEAPIVTILTPASGDAFNYGQHILFRGQATDPEEGRLTGDKLVWTSTLNGELGRGEQLSLNTLFPGDHTITLTATDSHGLSNIASLGITIRNEPPTAIIVRPQDGDSFTTNQHIRFEGRGEDPEDGVITNDTLRWVSDRNGFLGNGPTLDVNTLLPGPHQISLTVTDKNGLTSPAVLIRITLTNSAPKATILSPPDNSIFLEGETITLSGTGIDPEDGVLTGSSLTWTSDRDGILGTGSELRNLALSSGQHTITLMVRDKDGETDSTFIRLVAGNHPPVAEILSPKDGTHFMTHEMIEFQGKATDKEDGLLSGNALVWVSTRDGEIGRGALFSKNTLSPGRHDIRLTATDSKGASHTVQISITCGNTAPETPVIHRPLDGETFHRGTEITFHGSATDAEDGDLTGKALSWESNNAGKLTPLGTGNAFSLQNLASGEHRITLTAKDSAGASSQSSVTITVSAMAFDSPYPQLSTGASTPVLLQGGTGPYRVSNRYPQLLAFTITAETLNSLSLRLTGLLSGKTELTITDSASNAITLPVLIHAPDSPPPTAKARALPANAFSGERVRLSADRFDNIKEYTWTQTQGPPVYLFPEEGPDTHFLAPRVSMNTRLGFRLRVKNTQDVENHYLMGVTISPSGVSMEGLPEDALPIKTFNGSPVAIKQSPGLMTFSAVDPATIGDPVGRPALLPYGLLDMAMEVDQGETARFILYLPQAAPQGSVWMKYHPQQGWVDFDRNTLSRGFGDGAVFNAARDQVFLYVTDNGPWDTDPRAGVVRDPSGLALPVPSVPIPDSENGSPEDLGNPPATEKPVPTPQSGGGSGCFIRSLLQSASERYPCPPR
jgi:hypothetical protein